MEYTLTAVAIVLAYFLGNISPSTLLARAAGKDIKKEGSGNAGTTNALRVLGKKAAVITLVIDIGKGVVVTGKILTGCNDRSTCSTYAKEVAFGLIQVTHIDGVHLVVG